MSLIPRTLAPLGFCLLMTACSAFAEDVLYVRDGSTVKGTIIEIVRGETVKIRSPKGRVFVYRVIDIRRMEIDPITEPKIIRKDPLPQPDLMTKVSAPHEKWSIAAGGGMAMPVGAFGATSGDDAGLAAIGWMAVVDGSINLLPSLDVVTSGVLAFNELDFSQLDAQGYLIRAETSPWKSIWALSGLKAYTEVEPGTEFYGMGQAGIFFGASPSIGATPGTTSSGVFGFGLAAGACTHRADLSVRYLHAVSEYETIKIPGTMKYPFDLRTWSVFTVRTIGVNPGHSFYRQSIGCIMFTCAFIF